MKKTYRKLEVQICLLMTAGVVMAPYIFVWMAWFLSAMSFSYGRVFTSYPFNFLMVIWQFAITMPCLGAIWYRPKKVERYSVTYKRNRNGKTDPQC